MKRTLLLFLFAIGSSSYGQAPITSFYSLDGAQYAELVTLSSTAPIDETPNGPNAVAWNFTNLTVHGVSVDSNPAPTATEISTYPNTNHVSLNTATVPPYTLTNAVYSKQIGSKVYITGFLASGFNLNFSTDNALIANFPMAFGDTWTDSNVSGTFSNGTYSGTVTGTSVTSFDGFGTMSLHIDAANQTYNNVTRYKSVQNITLNYGVITNAGTIVRTTICYFDTSIPYPVPVFKSTKTVVNIPMLSIVNQTTTQLERFTAMTLNTNENVVANDFVIYPNPVKDLLSIKNNASEAVLSIAVTDLEGRIVLQSPYIESGVDLSNLSNGVYLVTVKTDKGVKTQKIVKN